MTQHRLNLTAPSSVKASKPALVKRRKNGSRGTSMSSIQKIAIKLQENKRSKHDTHQNTDHYYPTFNKPKACRRE